MKEIYIDNQNPDYRMDDYDIYTNRIVAKGNRYFSEKTIEEFDKAKEILDDIDFEYDVDMNWYKITDEQLRKIREIYNKCAFISDEIIMSVMNVLYPEKKFVKKCIRGYSQGDWQNIIYDEKEFNDEQINFFESLYLGKVTAIYYEDEDSHTIYDIVPDDTVWSWERENLADKVKEYLDLDKNEEIKIYQADGFIQSTRWKEVV